MAPSATWIIEIASFAFLTAWVRPLIWEFILDVIANPAASSLAELILRPVDKRSIVPDITRSLRVKEFAAIVDGMLVLMETI